MKLLSAFIAKIAGYRVIIVLAVLFGLFANLLLPSLEKSINEKAGKTVGVIDLQSGFHPSKVYEMIEDYGPEARKSYLLIEITVDVVYPIIYAFLFSVILFVFYEKLGVKAPIKSIYLLPFLTLLFDYAENLFIVLMLSLYPTKVMAFAYLCSAFTALKWATLILSILFVFYGGIMLLIKRVIAR